MFFKKRKYIHNNKDHNFNAAKQVVPYIVDLIRPTSVIDVGCGTGTWLKVFHDNGVSQIQGVEGDYLDKKLLVIDESLVIRADLEKHLNINRVFDLVVSLEVAEHLKEDSASTFVDSLTSLGKIILFSAAIPGQGGQNHINEQWPTYWQNLFSKKGYYFSDIVRKKFWNNSAVDVFYKQNMFLICHESEQQRIPRTDTLLNIVHPELFLKFRKKGFRKEAGYF